jgi:two-component system sensor histidine kinase PhcS
MGPGHAGQIGVGWREENGRWIIGVQDNGPGIPAEHLSRLLDPFFTTREVGQGVGLGLSVAHTIVKSHGGELRVENLSRGASFSFDLPRDSQGVSVHDRVG